MHKSNFIVFASLAAVVAGGTVMAAPAPMLEWAVASSGLSEVVPMAAPPLGMTFRAMASGAAAVLAAALSVVVLPAMGAETGQGKKNMGFAFARIASFARGRNRGEDVERISFRRADAHPDNPARLPIFASRDLGEPVPMSGMAKLLPGDHIEVVPSEIVETLSPDDEARLEMPHAPDPLPWETIKVEIERVSAVQGPVTAAVDETALHEGNVAIFCQALEELSIADLSARFEAGLARRRAQQDAVAVEADDNEVSSVSAFVRPEEDDTDLQAALAALRGITAKAG